MIVDPEYGFALHFKTQKLLIEFRSERLSRELRTRMLAFSQWFYLKYALPTMITSIIRDDSVAHKAGKAIDIRCKYFAPDIVTEILNYWQERFPRYNQCNKRGVMYIARSAYAHDSGRGFHIHISID